MNSETINKLEEIKQRFEKSYEEQIKSIEPEDIIKTCLEYLDYDEDSKTGKGNAAMKVNDLVKKVVNVPTGSSTQTLNLSGIIELLNKKIQSLNTSE